MGLGLRGMLISLTKIMGPDFWGTQTLQMLILVEKLDLVALILRDISTFLNRRSNVESRND